MDETTMPGARAPVLEHKFCDGGKAARLHCEGMEIAGYASLFDTPDAGGDVVAQGAYAASLRRLAETGRRVRMLWQHDPAQPIGLWDEVREDARGLYVRGRLLDAVARAREAAALITAGAIDGLSIGYRTRRATSEAGGGRRLAELELWEVSLVTFPMLPAARVAAGTHPPPQAKAARQVAAQRDLARALRAARAALRSDAAQ